MSAPETNLKSIVEPLVSRFAVHGLVLLSELNEFIENVGDLFVFHGGDLWH